jgi:hypothetical protein
MIRLRGRARAEIREYGWVHAQASLFFEGKKLMSSAAAV